MPFACIYVPNFPVAAALRAEPELQARAVAILEGKPPLEKIIAVNPKAARMGIAPGMTKAQAELCSELALRPRSRCRNPPRMPPCSTALNRSRRAWKTPVVTPSYSISRAWNRFSGRCPKFLAPSTTARTRSDSRPTLPWLPIPMRPCSPPVDCVARDRVARAPSPALAP